MRTPRFHARFTADQALARVVLASALLFSARMIRAQQQAVERVLHVASTGADTNPGTLEAPLRSIGHALELAAPGVTIMVHAGTYRERIAPNASGEPGRPITIRGERDDTGGWTTHIDSTVPLQAAWEPAPEVGPGVFKTQQPGFEPHHMQVGGRFIPRLWPTLMRDGTGFEKLALPDWQPTAPEAAAAATAEQKASRIFWDVAGAVFGCLDGVVYLRFRGGDDPNGKQLAAAPAAGGIQIENQHHLVVRDLAIHGGESCVCIKGMTATDNIIEHCRLTNGNQRAFITDGASRNHIRHNEMTIDFYSDACVTGAWGCGLKDDDVPYELQLKRNFYGLYKHVFGPNSTSDYGVRIFRSGPRNRVYGNHIFRGGQGIAIHDARDTFVYENKVHEFSSLGLICTLNRVANAQFYDNLVVDCNINLRIHHVNEPRQSEPRSFYAYRNRFRQTPGVGTHIYFHYWEKNDVEPYVHPDIFIYHNSFAGGLSGLSVSGYADECGGLPRTIVLNNILSSQMNLRVSMPFVAGAGMVGVLDYNWLGGAFKTARPEHDFTKAPWYGSNNTFVPGGKVWDGTAITDFAIPDDCRARGTGLDLSRPFVCNGKAYEALPGMKPGYFSGPRPDPGAIQQE